MPKVDSTLTDNKNFLQPTGFKVSIERSRYGNLEYFAQSVIHPGASVPITEMPVPRIRNIPYAGDAIDYGQLDIELILDEDLKSYTEMQNWLERIVNQPNLTRREAENQGVDPTSADITVTILTSHNNANLRIKYNDCIPISLGQITLASTGGSLSYITFSASFRFRDFEIS